MSSATRVSAAAQEEGFPVAFYMCGERAEAWGRGRLEKDYTLTILKTLVR